MSVNLESEPWPDNEEGQTGSEGAVYLVSTLIDPGISHGNMGYDEPARSQWD